nr:hypothetical protein [Tanacetum cinerariifolium]
MVLIPYSNIWSYPKVLSLYSGHGQLANRRYPGVRVELIYNFLPPHYMLQHMRELLELLASSDHEQPIPPVPEAPDGQQVAPEILSAHAAWQAEQELLQIMRDFHSCRQEEGQSVSSYVLKMKGYIDNLECLGHPVTLGLGKGNKHNKSHSKKGAKGQNQGKGKFVPKHKIPPPPKRENPAKDSICHECGEIGHWKRNCPQYLAELMKKKKNTASGAGGSGSKG